MPLTAREISDRLQSAAIAPKPTVPRSSRVDGAVAADLKCAAVLVPLVREAEEWQVLYTRRTQLVETHKGQVSFPGGACEEGERTPEQTALRELHEEIGVDASHVQVLGRLPAMTTVTSYRVTPVVGVLDWPFVFSLAEREVERIFTVPLTWLAQADHRWAFQLPGRGDGVTAFHPYDGELIWGATANMTVELLTALGY